MHAYGMKDQSTEFFKATLEQSSYTGFSDQMIFLSPRGFEPVKISPNKITMDDLKGNLIYASCFSTGSGLNKTELQHCQIQKVQSLLHRKCKERLSLVKVDGWLVILTPLYLWLITQARQMYDLSQSQSPRQYPTNALFVVLKMFRLK